MLPWGSGEWKFSDGGDNVILLSGQQEEKRKKWKQFISWSCCSDVPCNPFDFRCMVCSGFFGFFPYCDAIYGRKGISSSPHGHSQQPLLPPSLPCSTWSNKLFFFCLVQFPSLYIISYIISVLISGSIISYFQAPLRIAINTTYSSILA